MYAALAFGTYILHVDITGFSVHGKCEGDDCRPAIEIALGHPKDGRRGDSDLVYFTSPLLLELVGRDKLGENYLYSLDLLRMLIFSSFFVAFVSIYLAIKRIRKDTNELIVVSGLITLMIIISCYAFIKYFGFMGVGYGWIAGYGFSFAIIGILVFREIQSAGR